MKPVHQEVRAAVLRRIQGLSLETRLPSDRELAREFNVAFLTINRVMNDLEREGYVERRARKGTWLASHERSVQTSDEHRGGGNGVVVFAYPNWFSHPIWQHLRLAEALAVKGGLRLVEYKLNPDSTPARLLDFAARQEGLAGVLLLPVPNCADLPALAALGRPVVLLSSEVAVDGHPGLHAFDTDWSAAGRLVAARLLDAGHRRLAWINCEPGRDERLVRGMRHELKQRGLRPSDLTTYALGAGAWSDARANALVLTRRLLDEGVASAAFVDSLAGAAGVLRALWERDRRCPEHLSLIAAGDQSGAEGYCTPALTTLDSDWDAEMQRAFAVLRGESAATGTAPWRIPVRLVERESVAAV